MNQEYWIPFFIGLIVGWLGSTLTKVWSGQLKTDKEFNKKLKEDE